MLVPSAGPGSGEVLRLLRRVPRTAAATSAAAAERDDAGSSGETGSKRVLARSCFADTCGEVGSACRHRLEEARAEPTDH